MWEDRQGVEDCGNRISLGLYMTERWLVTGCGGDPVQAYACTVLRWPHCTSFTARAPSKAPACPHVQWYRLQRKPKQRRQPRSG
jgi:hypothetical protein